MASFSILSLGTRRDAKQFRKGAVDKLGLTAGAALIAPKPSLSDIKSLFARTDDVLFIAGHFSGTLYNADSSIDLAFANDKLTITYDLQKTTLTRGVEFKQTNCKLIIWGGCSVCDGTTTIATMRKLFGQHVMIGWIGQTGWEMTDIMLGGKGNGSSEPEPLPQFASPNYFEKLNGSIADPAKLWKGWLTVAKALSWGNDPGGTPYIERFCAVDINGNKHLAAEAIA